MSGPDFDAIVLAGGRGSRLGGVDKAALILDQERLVDRVVAAARAEGASRVVAVGPPHVGDRADRVVREDPPFSGPLAALAAALPEIDSPWIMLLACDLVRPSSVVSQLRSALSDLSTNTAAAGVEGVILVDEEERRQWLAGIYSSRALRAAMAERDGSLGTVPDGSLRSVQNGSLRSVLGGLELREIEAERSSTEDIDTSEQLARARAARREEDR